MNGDVAAPLVGRRDALRALQEALAASSAGTFRVLCLVGEPGAGKTRLLGELATAAAGLELPALWGRAAEFEQEMPFGAVIDALDDQVEASLPGLAGAAGRGDLRAARHRPAGPAGRLARPAPARTHPAPAAT